jgi:phage protein U
MYATLGNDIVFDVVKQPASLSDKRETMYAATPLVNGKPNLQRTGEALIEVSMSVMFHFDFCDPETEYLKLNNARVRGEILPLIFSNGRNEGDFVITTLERTIDQTDGFGNFVQITCNIGLKEFANITSPAKQLEQDKKNAFAVSSNRPLPANQQQVPTNPALSACQENQEVKYSANKVDDLTNKVSDDVDLVTNADPDQQLIDKAQKFVDSLGAYIPKVNEQVTKANNSLGSINALIGAYSSITGISPTISTDITALQTSLSGVSTQLTVLGSLPGTISNVTDAGTALTAMTNTLLAVKAMNDNQETLNNSSAPLAKAVAAKTILT